MMGSRLLQVAIQVSGQTVSQGQVAVSLPFPSALRLQVPFSFASSQQFSQVRPCNLNCKSIQSVK